MTNERDDGERAAGPAPVVAFDHISKTYANGTVALRDVSFSVPSRSIHAICGENGAGKSTLMKILFGLEEPTSGRILLDGQPVSTATRDFAGRYGIGMVHQHFSLIPTLSVTENIILGQEPRKGLLIDRAAARDKVETLSRKYGLAVDPDAITGRLPVAAQQKVEILKALSRNTRILILDEPTAVLSPPEISELFSRLRDLSAHGIAILFISHKLNEVRSLAETVTVLRAGQLAGTARLADVPDNMIMQMVMGRPVEITRRQPRRVAGEPLLAMSGIALTSPDPADRLRGIDLAVHAGEIVGIAGVDGSGQRGLVSLVTGTARPVSGEIRFDGEDMRDASTARWRARGMAHLPSDRFIQGGVPALTLIENAIAGTDGDIRFQRGPFLRRHAISAAVEGMVGDYSIRALSIGERLDSLSGGNAQKLIAARELATEPRFLIADQPTRGIDVAAAAFIHKRIVAAAERGAAVLLITADLDELLRLSDRVVVMFGGQITAVLANEVQLTPERLGPYMLGLEGMP